ncbi:hypothetical protein ACF06N_20410 [Streptomyces albidoflavus]
MAAAQTLARPPPASRPPAPSPAALGLLPRTVAPGTTIAGAIESLGLSAYVVRRRAMSRTTRTPGARLAYRLVEREE